MNLTVTFKRSKLAQHILGLFLISLTQKIPLGQWNMVKLDELC